MTDTDHPDSHKDTHTPAQEAILDAAHHLWTAKIGNRSFGAVLQNLASKHPGDPTIMDFRNAVQFLQPSKTAGTYTMPPGDHAAMAKAPEIVKEAFAQEFGDNRKPDAHEKEMLGWAERLKQDLANNVPLQTGSHSHHH